MARGGVGTGYSKTIGTYDTPPVIAVPGPPGGGSRRGHAYMETHTFPHAWLTPKGVGGYEADVKYWYTQ